MYFFISAAVESVDVEVVLLEGNLILGVLLAEWRYDDDDGDDEEEREKKEKCDEREKGERKIP